MAQMTVAEIDAELTELRAALSARLKGQTMSRVTYESSSVDRALPTVEELRMAIAELEAKRNALTGEGSGPVRFGFGSRT